MTLLTILLGLVLVLSVNGFFPIPPCDNTECDAFDKGDLYALCLSKYPTEKFEHLQHKCYKRIDSPIRLKEFLAYIREICYVDFKVDIKIEIPPCVDLPPPCPTDICDALDEGYLYKLCFSKYSSDKLADIQHKCHKLNNNTIRLEKFTAYLREICYTDHNVDVKIEIPPCDPKRIVGDNLRKHESIWTSYNYENLIQELFTYDAQYYSPYGVALNIKELQALVGYIRGIGGKFILVGLLNIGYTCGEDGDEIETLSLWKDQDGKTTRIYTKYRFEDYAWKECFDIIQVDKHHH